MTVSATSSMVTQEDNWGIVKMLADISSFLLLGRGLCEFLQMTPFVLTSHPLPFYSFLFQYFLMTLPLVDGILQNTKVLSALSLIGALIFVLMIMSEAFEGTEVVAEPIRNSSALIQTAVLVPLYFVECQALYLAKQLSERMNLWTPIVLLVKVFIMHFITMCILNAFN